MGAVGVALYLAMGVGWLAVSFLAYADLRGLEKGYARRIQNVGICLMLLAGMLIRWRKL